MQRIVEFKRALEIISRFKDSRILVIGDIMMDEFIWGKVSRISPEAPVPVVNVTSESQLLGGAANVVNNIVSLEGNILVCGVVGDDEIGKKIVNDLKGLGIDINGVIIEKGRPATVKTRIVAQGQQIVRYDREDSSQINQDSTHRIISYLKRNLDSLDAVIFSDYGKGIISEQLIRDVLNLVRDSGKIISVDPKVNNFPFYKDVTVITPNNIEASEASGIEIRDEETLLRAGEILLNRLACKLLLITLGEEGMMLFESSGETTHIRTCAKEVYDVTGAGDTVVSVLTMALTSGSTLKEASALANYAAGIVVGELGTAVVTKSKLLEVIRKDEQSETSPAG